MEVHCIVKDLINDCLLQNPLIIGFTSFKLFKLFKYGVYDTDI